jgi:hypothetical protein
MQNKILSKQVLWLGRAGLLPFLALATASWLSSAQWSQQALAIYALAIGSFLLGSWWGMALIRRYSPALWLSNALVIAAVAALMLGNLRLSLLVLAALLVAIFGIEQRLRLFSPQPMYYQKLRAELTAVACLCLIVAAAAP